MDACLTVEREQDRLAKKYTNIKEHTDSSLTELINQITSIQEELSKGKNKVLFFYDLYLNVKLEFHLELNQRRN